MSDFLLVFRADYSSFPPASPEEMQARTKKWLDWTGSIAAQNKLAAQGNRLIPTDGRVLRGNGVITDGPYTEIKEVILGYTMVKADDYEDAVQLASGCPILQVGGTVEVREVNPL